MLRKTTTPSVLLLLVILLFFVACQAAPAAKGDSTTAREVPVIEIPLSGAVTDKSAEVSGLAWYADTLIILPQYPGRFPSEVGGSIFAIPKEEILAFLSGENISEITPLVIPFDDQGFSESIPGFEGFEAIGFDQETAFLTIEAKGRLTMMGYLVSGWIASDLSLLQLIGGTIQEISPQADLSNYSDEALLILDDKVITFYEANGANVNPKPVGHIFDFSLNDLGELPFPTLEYRLTDVTMPDKEGRFWGINYLFSGNRKKLDPAPDGVAFVYGTGESHAQSEYVERLVQFLFTDEGIIIADSPPIQLQLLENGEARNWEGIVRLDELGFLLMTDKKPGTILGFVPIP